MSEEEPEDNSGPVYYVTGKNFANLIAQTDKHSKFKNCFSVTRMLTVFSFD